MPARVVTQGNGIHLLESSQIDLGWRHPSVALAFERRVFAGSQDAGQERTSTSLMPTWYLLLPIPGLRQPSQDQDETNRSHSGRWELVRLAGHIWRASSVRQTLESRSLIERKERSL